MSSPPEAGARRGRPGYNQATVLRRAIELFNTQGYDATSIGDLARDLGLTKSAIYHHVPSKEHLLAAALDEGLDALEAAIDSAVTQAAVTGAAAIGPAVGDPAVGAGGDNAYERLRAVVRASVSILVAHLPAVTLLLRVRGNSDVELAALKRRRVLDDKLTALVEAAVAEGALREDIAPQLISRLLFGTVNSLVEWYRPGGPVDPDDLARALESLVFDGLRINTPDTR